MRGHPIYRSTVGTNRLLTFDLPAVWRAALDGLVNGDRLPTTAALGLQREALGHRVIVGEFGLLDSPGVPRGHGEILETGIVVA